MTDLTLARRLREVTADDLPLPGHGTAERFRRLWEIGSESLSLVKLAEAHFDALAILAESGRRPVESLIHAVWASEVPTRPLRLEASSGGFTITGVKNFCSGIGLVDRALITAGDQLIEIDLLRNQKRFSVELGAWSTDAFCSTNTGSISFDQFPCPTDAKIGAPGWYTQRPGFWSGACGVAACWAGGADGLVRFAQRSAREDSHTLAHLGAMSAAQWAMKALVYSAANEIDGDRSADSGRSMIRALQLRHLVEQHCTDILRRLARAYGPHPLAIDQRTALRYHELDLYLRQSHAERDLETLGSCVHGTSRGQT